MRLLLLLLSFLPVVAFASDADTTTAYLLTIDSDIHAKTSRMLDKALKEASERDATVFILKLNTYGGALDAADKMRTALLKAPFTTVAFIDNQAASAGALIAIACDSIYMSEASSIGSATVVNQTGEPMPEKYQSFMRSMMRTTAQTTGRDPLLAERMVDGDTIVNLTTQEAIDLGFCQGKALDVYDVMDQVGASQAVLVSYKPTWLDRIIGFFLLPLVQGLLLMGMIGGVFFELKTPGIGFPLALAVVCAVGYFSPLFLEGLVQYWELIIIGVGLILLILEIFVTPGFGVLGILGIIGVFVGLALTMIDNQVFRYEGPFDWNTVMSPIAVVTVSGFLSLLGLLLLVNRLFPTRLFNKIALRTDLDAKEGFVGVPVSHQIAIGDTGTSLTDLHPVGKVALGTEWVEAAAAIGYIARNTPVKVVRVEGGTIYVEAI